MSNIDKFQLRILATQIADDLTNQETAKKLFQTVGSIKVALSTLYKSLGVHSVREAHKALVTSPGDQITFKGRVGTVNEVSTITQVTILHDDGSEALIVYSDKDFPKDFHLDPNKGYYGEYLAQIKKR